MTLSLIPSLLRKRPVLAAALVALPALLVYLRTLAPGIVFGDSPELSTAAYVGGIAHPTGYPTYMLIGWLVTHYLPVGSVAYRMNLLSAVTAAAAIALVYLLALRIVKSRMASAATALLLAFSLTFWSRAIIAEAYVMHLALVVTVLLCVVSWDRSGSRRWLLAAALVWGLSFTHHMQTILLAPALLYYILTTSKDRRVQFVRELRWTVPLFLAPLCLYLYLPLSTLWQPRWTFADTGSWPGFRDHVSGVMYRAFMGTKSWAELWRHMQDYGGWLIHDDARRPDRPAYLLSQFSISVLWLAPWGLYGLWRRQRRLFGLTVLFYVSAVCWALNYTIYNVDVYYLPSHMIVALWIGCGLRQLQTLLARTWRRIKVPKASRNRMVAGFGAALLVLPLMLVPANWTSNDLHSMRSVDQLGEALLDSLKPNALLLSSGDNWVFPALYSHFVNGRRPDVAILPVYWFAVPSNAPQIQRLTSSGYIVNMPKDSGGSGVIRLRRRLVEQFLMDNTGKHPLYLAGPLAETIAGYPELRRAIPGLKYVGGNEPVYEIVERAQSNVALPVAQNLRRRQTSFGKYEL